MKNIFNKNTTLFFLSLLFSVSACEDFVEVEVPNYKITSETVFSSDETAHSAMTGVYNRLFNSSFSNGGSRSVTFLAGLTADNFTVTSSTFQILEFGENAIDASNSWNLDLWAGCYNMVYMVNAILENVANSNALSEKTKKSLEGQAKFIRAFTYLNLTNLYGEVPLLLSTDYHKNATAPRNNLPTVFNQIIVDLEDAILLLENDYANGERTRPNVYAAMALLARTHLYLENWEQAEYYSSKVIDHDVLYRLLKDTNDVFLANSEEAIWQISPLGWGSSFTHTNEGNLFIPSTTSNPIAILSESFLNQWMDQEDLRLTNWVASFTSDGKILFYPYKYKIQYDASGGRINEYSMVLRLAEQYLIRAEANVHLGNLQNAIADVDKIRERAEITLISESNPHISESELLETILQERRKEFFAEWGHRWFDLKRFRKSFILSQKPNTDWQETDIWYPIPSNERLKNPKLTQNDGY
ncbi:RagB/SusD family nutrient uptake outer membrane protein [Gelidibacter japonicus]|uniref:RagB/SusD family nutrient uptake outer membrane protein n=1 Tax=Gelidibacter japonicus TaxID=1962232 RepID=UPI0020209AF8|nr:RagB/SusD family nutrient uptake outer membrane protein [Gelidibacter japonicus]MCL8008308.1 RagB/SusD family nutrient uptake outer membrane protein [Gelidibacter japonicus]